MIIPTLTSDPLELGQSLRRIQHNTASAETRKHRAGFLQRFFTSLAKRPVAAPERVVTISPTEVVHSLFPLTRRPIVFERVLSGHYRYDFTCEGCGRVERLCVPKEKRGGIRCPAGCGTVYKQLPPEDDLPPRLASHYVPDVIAVD